MERTLPRSASRARLHRKLDLSDNLSIHLAHAKPEFSGRIVAQYPVVVGQPTTLLSLTLGPVGSGINQQATGVQWVHRKVENGTRLVLLAPDFAAIEYGKDDYDHFPLLRSEVELVVTALREIYNVPNFTRIGLRYINEIVIQDGNPLNWDGIIAPNLVAAATAGKQAEAEMVRSMHQLITSLDFHAMEFT